MTFAVTDSVTGKPVQGAVVYLNGLHIRTNYTGIAVFSNVALGTYNYKVSKDDYLTASGSISVTGNIKVLVKLVREDEEESFLSTIYKFFRW